MVSAPRRSTWQIRPSWSRTLMALRSEARTDSASVFLASATRPLRPTASQPVDRPVQQLPDDRLGGRIPGQGVQVALHSSGRGPFTHEKKPLPRWHPRGFYRVPCPPATLSITAGEKRAQHRPPRNRPHCHRDDRLASSRRLASSSGGPSRARSSLPATRHMAQDEVTTSSSPEARR
jgi:hypothetical protein